MYRYLVEDFVIQFCRNLQKRDFVIKNDGFSSKRNGKREYLNEYLTNDFVKALNQYWQSKIRIPRIRMGEQQEIETLINEEAMLLGMYLRSEKKNWIPRTAMVT